MTFMRLSALDLSTASNLASSSVHIQINWKVNGSAEKPWRGTCNKKEKQIEYSWSEWEEHVIFMFLGVSFTFATLFQSFHPSWGTAAFSLFQMEAEAIMVHSNVARMGNIHHILCKSSSTTWRVQSHTKLKRWWIGVFDDGLLDDECLLYAGNDH